MSVLGRLIRLLAPFRWWVVLAVVLSFATVGSSVGLMAVSSYLISRSALATSVTELSVAITAVRFFAVARASMRYLERLVTHTATFRILTRLRVWFYTGIEPLAPARLMAYPSGDLLARIVSDIETLENFYVRVIVPPLAAVFATAFACLILGAFDAVLALALLVFLLLTGGVLPLATRWLSRQPSAGTVAARAGLNAALVDEIQGLADLTAFGREADHQARTLRLGEELSQLQERVAVVRGLGDALAALFTGLAGLTVLWLAIPLVTAGRIDGVYLALLPLTAIASFEAVQPLAQAMQYLEASRAAAGRLFELIDAAPAVVDPVQPLPLPADCTVEFQDVCFSYGPGEPQVLRQVTFRLPAGESLALVGPSGAGKSTLVNLLLRFWDYRNGHIRLGGRELHDLRAEDVRGLTAVVSQHTHLFNASVRDNLLLAKPGATDDELVAACREACLHDFIATLPLGYDTMIGENGLRLSGGERQRLAIARAVLRDAPILILDEPASHLDPVTEGRVWQALGEFMRGRTTLLITHGRGGLEYAGQVLELPGSK